MKTKKQIFDECENLRKAINDYKTKKEFEELRAMRYALLWVIRNDFADPHKARVEYPGSGG